MTTKLKPWQARAGVAPRAPLIDVAVRGVEPLAQITIYPQMTLLSRRVGRTYRQYPISPDALAQTLTRQPIVSGLLPANTLGTGRLDGTPYYVVYVPARVIDLQIPDRTYTIPTPPLVWGGWRREYRIWALGATDYPTRTDLPLFRAPFPNCYTDGCICWGNVQTLPEAVPQTLLATLKLFQEESYFNAHVANGKSVSKPTSVLALYDELDPSQPYPLDDLMPAEMHLGWLLNGGPWRRS